MGNIVSQIPGGILTQKYGGKAVLVTSTFLSAIFIALTPLAVMFGEKMKIRFFVHWAFLNFISLIGDASGLIFTRIMIGFLQGPLITCLGTFFVRWFPIEERGRTTAICFMGGNVSSSILKHFIVSN